MQIAIVGAGQRGSLYASYMLDKGASICAVVEPNDERRRLAVERFGIAHEFSSVEDFVAAGKLADAAVVATPDRAHYDHAMMLLDAGYHLLLEKPISESSAECIALKRKAEQLNLEIIVCHVLRYTNFFSKIKEIIDSGDIGRIVTIEYAEYMGNFHMAHSFVRGKWSNTEESSPIFLQKSCHDMDILCWLTGSRADKVSSFGSLTYFKESNAPAGSTERCADCPHADVCLYEAERTYIPMLGQWRAVDVTDGTTDEDMREALRTGPYGRCVYRCGNDVCDHQVAAIEFENGVTASFQMSGFSDRIHRRIKVMCEFGDIEGDDSENFITLRKYGTFSQVPTAPEIIELDPYIGRHGGGDYGIVDDFIQIMERRLSGETYEKDSSRSAISKSIQSHFICNAAEESRLTGQIVDMHEYIDEYR